MSTHRCVLHYCVGETEIPARLDQYLVAIAQVAATDEPLYGMTRSYFQKLIESGHVLVNGQILKASSKLKYSDTISIALPEPQPSELVPEPMDLDILFEDEHIIVLNKPAGLVVHPGAGHHHGTLVHGLLAHCHDLSGIGGTQRPGIVHRLDADTSGVMIVAKHDLAHTRLVEAFKARSVTKIYDGIVFGCPSPRIGIWDTPIERHPVDRKRFTSKTGAGKPSRTGYRVIHCSQNLAHLQFELFTGRTHQIRVHCSDAGYPLLGDPLYGRKNSPIHAPRMGRQALHAHHLSLNHPILRHLLHFEAPLPADIRSLLEQYFE